MEDWLGLVEFLFVAMFGVAWWILERVGKRLDRQREAERARSGTPASGG